MIKYIILILVLCVELFPQGNMVFNRKHYWDRIESTVSDTSTNIYVDGNNGSDSNDGLTSATAKLTFEAGIALVNASTDTIFVTGTFANPFAITKTCGLVLTAVFYSQNLTDYTYVPGSEGGSIVDTFYVGSGTDDKTRVSSTGLWDLEYLNMGAEYSNVKIATRFVNVVERSGYDSALIEYTAYDSHSADDISLRFYGEDDGSIPTYPSSYADFDDRYANLTTAYKDTTFQTDWVNGTSYKFRLGGIIGELFASYAYTGSQAISIFNVNNGSTASAFRSASAYDYSGGAEKAKLIIYSSGTASNAYYWKIENDSVLNVYFGSEAGNAEKSDKSLLAAAKDWCYNNDTLYVYGEALPPSGTADKYVCADCIDVDATDDSATTIAEVNAWTLVAGDTVAFKVNETFNDAQFILKNNVVYTSYNGDGRYILQRSDLTTEDYVVYADAVSGATLQNAEVIGKNWITANGSSGLLFDNIYCHHYENTNYHFPHDGRGMFKAAGTSNLYMRIQNSIFISGFPLADSECGAQDSVCMSDMLLFWDGAGGTGYISLVNNFFMNTCHGLIGLGNGNNHIFIRGNRFYNQFHHGLFQYDDQANINNNIIADYNYFERSGNGQRGTNNKVQYNREIGAFGMDSQGSIYRYNVVRTGGVPRRYWNNVGGSRMEGDSKDNRVYNNVFHDSYETAGLRFCLSDGKQYLSNNNFFNNSFTAHGDTSYYRFTGVTLDSAMIILWDESVAYSPSLNYFTYNYFGSKGNNLVYLGVGSANTNTTAWNSSGFYFSNNIDGILGNGTNEYDNPNDSLTNYTYWTPQTSRGNLYDSVLAMYNGKAPLIDAGRPHTYINGTVNNDTILVDDARVFFDGWNWLEGDSLLIDTFRVQVIGINYTTNYIALSGIVNVLDNTPVYLINPYTHDAYKESAIDIGLE